MYAIPSGAHPSGCSRNVVLRDERVDHLNDCLFFIDVHPADFARPGEYLLVDSVGLGTKGCVEIYHVSLEGIRVQCFHPGVAKLACLHALYLQSG